MSWISFTVPANRNDLFSDLLMLSSHRKSLIRAYHSEKGDRVVEIYLDPEGARAAQEIMTGQSLARSGLELKKTQAEAALDFL